MELFPASRFPTSLLPYFSSSQLLNFSTSQLLKFSSSQPRPVPAIEFPHADRTRPAARIRRQAGERRTRPRGAPRRGRQRIQADLLRGTRLRAVLPAAPGRPGLCESRRDRSRVRSPRRSRQKAAELGVVVVLNLFERDGERTFDSSPVIDADGSLLGCTRMIHITEYAVLPRAGLLHAGRHGRAGLRHGGRPARRGHLLRPALSRSTCARLAVAGAELVVVPQAGSVGEWPEGLYEAEMQVAAFQNGYFTALCNRVGEEECLTFGGESFVCAPNGTVIAKAPAGRGDDSLRRPRPPDTRSLRRAAAVPQAPKAGTVRTVDIDTDISRSCHLIDQAIRSHDRRIHAALLPRNADEAEPETVDGS